MKDSAWKLVIFFALSAIEAVLLFRLFTAPPDQAGLLTGAVIAVAAAMALAPRLFDLLSVQLPGFSAQLREVQHNLDETKQSVAQTDMTLSAVNEKLDTLFALSISDWQYHNLEKIVSGRFGQYVRSVGLENDLRHLRNHGYIEVPSVRDIPDVGGELCDFVKATDTGRLFVQLRTSLNIPSPILLKQTRLAPSAPVERDRELGRPRSAGDVIDVQQKG